MPKARRTSYNLALKLKIVAEAEAVENNSEIAREYGISESMVRRWRKDQANLFNGEIKLSAKRKTMGCFTPKYPELDQRILEWFTEQRSQGKFFVEHWFCILKQRKQDHEINQSADCRWIAEWIWVECVTPFSFSLTFFYILPNATPLSFPRFSGWKSLFCTRLALQ